jgi:hypothetical protein
MIQWLLDKQWGFKLIKRFNDSKVFSFLLIPISWPLSPSVWLFFKTSQRLRICLSCGIISKDIHWSKYDYKNTKTNKICYDHVHLCSSCFLGLYENERIS